MKLERLGKTVFFFALFVISIIFIPHIHIIYRIILTIIFIGFGYNNFLWGYIEGIDTMVLKSNKIIDKYKEGK